MAKCPFRLGNQPNPLYVKDAPYNATGDGSTDDTSAVQACVNAGTAAGRIIGFPAGTYKVGQIDVPSNAILAGVGATSVLLNSTASSNGATVLSCVGTSGSHIQNVTIRDLKITGATIGAQQADVGVRLGYSDNITLLRLTFDKHGFCIYAGADSKPTTNIYITDCDILSNAHTGLFGYMMTGLHISGGDWDSYTSDATGTSHHIYLYDYIDTVTIAGLTTRNGSGYSLQFYESPTYNRNYTITNLTQVNVLGGIILQNMLNVSITNWVGSSNRYIADQWMDCVDSDDVLIDGFTLDGADAFGLITTWGASAGGVVLQNGTMTNCSVTYYNYTPPGCKTGSGSPATSTNNSVTT